MVTKAKNIREGRNPEGKEIFYTLNSGHDFNTQGLDGVPECTNMGGWRYLNPKSRQKLCEHIQNYCEAQEAANYELSDFYEGQGFRNE
jgi:hypothetical protein